MRHRNKGRKLGVSPSHRRALGKNMVMALIDNERIITTVPKAKQFKPLAERIIHLSKEKTLHNIRQVVKLLGNRDLQVQWVEDDNNPARKNMRTVVQKLFDDIGPRVKARNGGYTRIMRLAKRRLGDGGERCILELVDSKNIYGKGGDEAAAEAAPTQATAGA